MRFIIENGVLTRMEFDKFQSIETDKGLKQEVIGREILPCDTVVLAIAKDNAFPFIERNIGLEFGTVDMPVVDKTTFMSTRPGVFFGGDAAFGPADITSGPSSMVIRPPSPSTTTVRAYRSPSARRRG